GEPAPAGGGSAPAATPRRAAYAGIDLYDPGRFPTAVDLSDNTSRFGMSPAAARVLASLDPEHVTRYPSVFAAELKETLAEALGLAPENIATGCGSDDLIDSAVRAFAEPGEMLAYPEPTFGMVPTFGRMNALRPVPVPWRLDAGLDAEALLATRARITYVCRPNNPTGTLAERSAVERLERDTPGVVLVDEAYADFAGDDMAAWAASSRRAIVLRTFSKAYGLAGLRVGWAVGPAPLIRELEKSRGPYKVGGPAAAAAVAAVREDATWLTDVLRRTRENRERLAAALRERGLFPLPSAANFLLVPLPAPLRAGTVAGALRRRGVQVRPFPALAGIGDALRVSVGPWEQMEAFLGALAGALEQASVNTDLGGR
ncbi:MAG TPA: histidinol-phosphate transaminase, partial [Longimicrobiales bacterium]|nr:histidinol-phosphate transaminase [Longimicrobiales bacterium]